MADHSTIADITWNPVRGDQPAPDVLGQPWHWVKPRRVSVSSTFDLFHESVPFEYIAAAFWVMSVTTRHTYQVLTKRPARMLEFFRWLLNQQEMGIYAPNKEKAGWWLSNAVSDIGSDHPACKTLDWMPATSTRGGYDNCGPGWPYENVWLGVSVGNQEAADERIPLLLQCPAAVRWLSCEPLLGPINFRWAPYAHRAAGQTYREYLDANGGVNEYEALRLIDWVVAGGESGTGARPMHPDWARSLRDQCAAAGVSFFFRQWGEWVPGGELCKEEWCWGGGIKSVRIGKKAAGRLLDGVEHNAYPEKSNG